MKKKSKLLLVIMAIVLTMTFGIIGSNTAKAADDPGDRPVLKSCAMYSSYDPGDRPVLRSYRMMEDPGDRPVLP